MYSSRLQLQLVFKTHLRQLAPPRQHKQPQPQYMIFPASPYVLSSFGIYTLQLQRVIISASICIKKKTRDRFIFSLFSTQHSAYDRFSSQYHLYLAYCLSSTSIIISNGQTYRAVTFFSVSTTSAVLPHFLPQRQLASACARPSPRVLRHFGSLSSQSAFFNVVAAPLRI